MTDLGFVRIGGPSRFGWFHPNAEGERLMPCIAAVLPALRACNRRDAAGEACRPGARPQLRDSAEFADLAEALHHAESLDLTLHHEDGSLIPTEDIGIQDTEQLLALANWDELDGEAQGAFDEPFDELDDLFDDGFDEMLGEYPAIAQELDSDAAEPFRDEAWDRVRPWTPADDQPAVFPRYQIHVRLVAGVVLP
ncbi:MAG TPA: hypothetical protein VKA84_24775 [Gemmatimonadaceae bacterium]|nr:hypothetical protein [Gemmatimonadaceae bacterium]